MQPQTEQKEIDPSQVFEHFLTRRARLYKELKAGTLQPREITGKEFKYLHKRVEKRIDKLRTELITHRKSQQKMKVMFVNWFE